MAKKNTSGPAKTTAPKAKVIAPEVVTTPVRNTSIPPKSAATAASPAKKSPPSYDAVALRAYFIWKSGGGSSFDNWIRAERELGV